MRPAKNFIYDFFFKTLSLGKKVKLTDRALDVEITPSGEAKFFDEGKELINFASCSYLGLETDPRVLKGVQDAVAKYGTCLSMSRLFASNPLYRDLEANLQKIFDCYPVVTLSTTLGSISFMNVFIQKNDILLLDQHVHESIQLSAKTTIPKKTTIEILPHNRMDLLEAYLEEHKQSPSKIWYFADGIYSMSGHLIPMDRILYLLEKYENFHCFIDDAHGMSCHGNKGQGYVLNETKIHPKMIVALSFSKAFGMGCGAAVLFPTEEMKDYFQVCAPTIRFNGPLPPPMLGAGVVISKIHLSNEITLLQKKLHHRIRLLRGELQKHSIPLESSELSPVQFVTIGDLDRAVKIATSLKEQGYFVSIATFPAVSKNGLGIRFAVNNHMSEENIIAFVSAFSKELTDSSPSQTPPFLKAPVPYLPQLVLGQ